MSDQRFVPYQKITPHTYTDEDFELLENELGQNQDQMLYEQEQNEEFLKEIAQWRKDEKMRLKNPQIAILRKRFQDAVVQARKEVEKKKSQEEKSQKRLDFFEEIMMDQKQKEKKMSQKEENKKEKKMAQKEEKEKEILWDQFEWRMTQWKKEDKKIIVGEEKEKKIQEENFVIEVEESDDKNEYEESLQDCDAKSDNEIRLERFLEIQSKAFNDPKFSDFTIICGEKEFNVHRVILALHSDLLLNHDQNSSSMTLKDLDVNLVGKMLKFMYSGKVEGLEKNAYDLYLLARKFGVKELEKLCLKTIAKKITPSNVLNCLRLAFRFDLKELKQNAIFYVCAHIQEIQENKEWEEFAKENGEIVAAILKSVSERRDFSVGQSQGQILPEKMTTNHCPLVPMPPVFVPQNQPSQKPRRQTTLQALSKQMEKSQEIQPLTSIPLLHNPSLVVPLPQSQILPAPILSINSSEELPPYLPFGQLPPLTILEQMPTQIPYNGPIPQSQCQSVSMPPVSVSKSQGQLMSKNQGTSTSSRDAENLKTLQAMMREAENQKQSVSKNQGTSASWDAEMLKQQQDMMEAAKNAHQVFEAAELYKKSFPSPPTSAPLIPLPNPMMYPVSQEKYEDKNVPKLPEN